MSLSDIVTMTTMYLVIVLVAAESDPRANFCYDKCDDFEALERQCIEDKDYGYFTQEPGDCYESGFNDNTIKCLEECWPIAAPCRKACFDSYDTCIDQCPDYGNNCYEDCFQRTFAASRPEIPRRR